MLLLFNVFQYDKFHYFYSLNTAMKKLVLHFVLIALCFTANAQIAPQQGFTDKLALAQQQIAHALIKAPLVFNGNNYDLKYHRMNWSVDPDTLFISGEVTSYFKTTEPNVSEITFDMSSVLAVDSIIYHASDISYSLTSGDTLKIFLPVSLPLNQLDSVSVFYHGVPPGSGFGSFIKDVHDSVPVIWTLSEPFGAKEWWPCKNDLSDKVDSIDIYVTTPVQYRASSNGLLVSETVQGMQQTAHWKHRYPIAAYLIAIAVTNYQSFSVYAHYGADSIEVLNYVYPETFTTAQTDVQVVTQSLELYDSLFILYPFSDERYGHTQFNWGGGMEHQTNTFLFGFWHELMAHELAHQWVGDMITCGNWHDIWLNEGFATYWTGITYNYLFNGFYWPAWKRMQIDDIVSQPDGSVYCSDTTDVSRIFDGRLSYEKGAMLLHMLRWEIGDSAFFAGMRNYLTDVNLAYGYACSDDFITHMEAASDTSLIEFFNDWLYGEGYPEYSISCFETLIPGKIDIIINQTQSHPSVSYFEMFVPIEFKDALHDTIVVFNNSYSGQPYEINLDFSPDLFPDSIKFDPEMWLVATLDTILIIPSFLEEQQGLNNFKIYPNPVTDFLNIDNTSHQIQKVQLYDICGSFLRSEESDTYSKEALKIKMYDLPSGIYLLKAKIDNNVLTKKIIKL
jgi:hypothetical protein